LTGPSSEQSGFIKRKSYLSRQDKKINNSSQGIVPLKGQSGMGDIPFVAGMNLKDRAPATDVRNDHDSEDMIRAAY
jgi:hypothetical protein